MKFIVLHGYGQNGDIFRRKHMAVERHLLGKFPDASFVYPDAPMTLRSDDRPADKINTSAVTTHDGEDTVQKCIGPRGWCQLMTTREIAHGLEDGLNAIATVLREQGPFDGIIAFSQGTFVAAMVISLLEGARRRQAYEQVKKVNPNVFPYPEAFKDLNHPPFKFGVLYSGFMAVGSRFSWLYEGPRIRTPLLHFVGQWDPVVGDDLRDETLRRVCDHNGARVVVHPGAHHVPTLKHIAQLIPFILQHTASTTAFVQFQSTSTLSILSLVSNKSLLQPTSPQVVGCESMFHGSLSRGPHSRRPRPHQCDITSQRKRSLRHPNLRTSQAQQIDTSKFSIEKTVKGTTCTLKLQLEVQITCFDDPLKTTAQHCLPAGIAC